MPAPLSRRGFLLAAATVAVPAGAASTASAATGRSPLTAYADSAATAGASAAAGCTPSPTPPGITHAQGTLGSLSAEVRVALRRDNLVIRYKLTNIGSSQDTYIVSTTDEVTGFGSRAVTRVVAPGAHKHGVFYGTLSHQYMFYVDLSDGSTLSLGPLNRLPYCQLTRRKAPKPIYLPPARHS